MGRSVDAASTGLASDDAAASDNRLSLDPNDPAWKFTQEWQDGQTYNIKLRVTQTSPGEFTVESGEEAAGDEEAAPAEDARGAMAEGGEPDERSTAPSGGDGYRNPAMANLMSEA